VLYDRLVLGPGERWSGLGLTDGRPYFATVVVVAAGGLDDLAAALPAAVAPSPASRRPRRGCPAAASCCGAWQGTPRR
jgi:hypothetical protein